MNEHYEYSKFEDESLENKLARALDGFEREQDQLYGDAAVIAHGIDQGRYDQYVLGSDEQDLPGVTINQRELYAAIELIMSEEMSHQEQIGVVAGILTVDTQERQQRFDQLDGIGGAVSDIHDMVYEFVSEQLDPSLPSDEEAVSSRILSGYAQVVSADILDLLRSKIGKRAAILRSFGG